MHALLPQPKKLRNRKGHYDRPRKLTIGVPDAAFHPVASMAADMLGSASIHISTAGVKDDVTLDLDSTLKPGGYKLSIREGGVSLSGHDLSAVASGLQTLRQLVEDAPKGPLPCLTIDDWPDFPDRGVYYDVCRGRIPKLERLMELADHLARYKINQLQLYIEHTFAFRAHLNIGKGTSPLTADDILQLDAYCAARGIELLPSLACFGHLTAVLKQPEYRHLAEDWGIGKYTAPTDELPEWFNKSAWTLSPAVPEIYNFLDSQFAEFLPLFRSKRFNICCDETWDLGLGQSRDMCIKKGKGVVYLNHVKKVNRLVRKYGKRTLFWGDIIRHYPELIHDIPKDVTVLDWGYSHDHPFERIKDFKAAGLPFYACPGTSGWVSLFPRLPEAMASIQGFAKAGARHGAQGLLNTDWGDGGHYNFMEYSWHGYLFGAEQGWNVAADTSTYHKRFAHRFLKSDSSALINAIISLGDISHLGGPCYQSVWQTVLFAAPDAPIFHHHAPIDMSVSKNGVIAHRKQRFNAACGKAQLAPLKKLRKVLVEESRKKKTDPLGVLPYWIFAADTIACAARKMSVLGPEGKNTPAARRALRNELSSLMKRFEILWMARNRRSEIKITLKRYRQALNSLKN